MRKEIIGTNKELVKVWGVPFEKGTIIKVVFHNEKHTNTYRDSLSGGLYGYDVQIQQIDVYTKKDVYCISAPQWGYSYNDNKEYIKKQEENFKNACDELFDKMEIEKT